MLELKRVNKYYGEGTNRYHALKNIDLKVEKGEFIAVLGPSGSGKDGMIV